MESDIFGSYHYNNKYMCDNKIQTSRFSKIMYSLANIKELQDKMSKSESEIKNIIIGYLNIHQEEVNMRNEKMLGSTITQLQRIIEK
jgi:hypothetical protein